MINRVLIRIKVVQLLYSYLLTQSDFRIEQEPESASRDIRYAHSAYIDLLLLLIELSGYPVNNEHRLPIEVDSRLASNKVGAALSTDDDLRTVILRGNSRVHLLDDVLARLLAKIRASKIYDDYSRKTRKSLDDDVTFWVTVFETIIATDQEIADALRADEAFTNNGLQMAIKKVCKTLRSYNDSRQMLIKAKKDLNTSLDKAYELYLGLLKLMIELTDEQAERLETARTRYNATSADLNPNTRLLDNGLVEYLRNDEQFNSLLADYKLTSAPSHPLLLRNLLDRILKSDLYKAYIEKPVIDFATDVEFWRDVMRNIILPSDDLAEEMEDRSVYWNDDLMIMGTFVLKTLRQISRSEGRHVDILPKYKDDEDERFGPELFIDSVKNHEQYRQYIDKFIDSKHWELERMPYMDIIIMTVAIAELINYPKIPVPVTVNEYVEIANNYSTEKSGAFINGILFSVIKYLNEEGIIHKS